MMFENCSVFVLGDNAAEIMRLEVDAETQKNICDVFASAVMELVGDKGKVEFDGSYKPDQDEVLFIDNFQLPDEIKDAIRNPIGVAAYGKENDDYPSIKAIFVGERAEEDATEKFSVAFQRFRKDQYILPHLINIFWDQNTFRREKKFGISVSDSIDCYFADNELQFASFYFARQIFDLSGYYRSATNQEVESFTSNGLLSFEDASNFEALANSSIRRKIAMINDSGVLENHSAIDIKRLAQKAGIDLTVKNKKIVIPQDKEQIKVILSFLDEEAYKGPFTQFTYLANSKRKVSK